MMYGVGMQSIDPKTLRGMVIHPVAVVESNKNEDCCYTMRGGGAVIKFVVFAKACRGPRSRRSVRARCKRGLCSWPLALRPGSRPSE